MVRILIIMALLASLFYTVRHWQPAAGPAPGKVAENKAAKPLEEAPGEEETSGYYPAVPEALPDVEKGYIFSEKRKIEKDVPLEEGKSAVAEPGPEVLDSVAYTGSLIIGDVRRALVTFQDAPREAGPVNHRPGGIRRPNPQAAAASSTPQNKQLLVGDKLLGFVVARIEPNRIVFEKGIHKVEKFLYDRNKKRMEAVATRSEPPPATDSGGIPAEVPPDLAADAAAAPQRLVPGGGAVQPPPLPANRAVRRSQRLLGIDPSIKVPMSPVPGRPVPKH